MVLLRFKIRVKVEGLYHIWTLMTSSMVDWVEKIQWINFKSGQGDEAADSTDSTEPIHLVLQHLRESFSLS
ncbi:hypothetical protein HMPREF9418_1656 [Neisseria macacae ATCC 33926]|uniref:Uncharacterized protein n=1 Tax=Neisseria macacae ATCC 33926 TaxID=997348 RepID=A0AA36UJ18_9NEIS|nr:hypothetical protein HMPREF9418_1656 [Neisseria macacae ATCC 33926]